MDSQVKACPHCGAQISVNAQFCKSCGRPIAAPSAPAVTPTPARSSVQAGSSRSLWFIAGCAMAVALIACVAAIAVGGFFFFQNTPQARVTPTMIAMISTSIPTLLVSTATLPPTPTIATATPTIVPPTTPTTAPSPTPKCPPTPALPAGVLFSDDFVSRRVSECNGWDFASSEIIDFIWSANKYTISVKKQQWLGWDEPGGEFDNFGAETQAQPVGSNYAESSLFFRVSGKDATYSYYLFQINTDGRYRLSKKAIGTWVSPSPVDWTASPTIKPGADPNTIGVIAQGNAISLYINRVLVKTFTDNSPLSKGNVGVGVGTGDSAKAAVAFSQLTILTPEKAKADWGVAAAPATPSVAASSPQPEIVALEFPSEIQGNLTKYDGLVRFRDGDGDIARISFDPAFTQPPGFNYQPFGFEFTNPAVRWVEGNTNSSSGAFKFSNSCGGETIKVTYTATLYDKAGNKSAPYPFSFVCKSAVSNLLTVFFTIQNGSPTGYVIDKQGVKHTPPGYLTISGFHVAPGDRIVIQTDQPRFSLLFDCGTSPQTFTPCDFVADAPARLPVEIRKNASGSAYLNISRADNWAGTRSNFPTQRYPADPVLRIGFGD